MMLSGKNQNQRTNGHVNSHLRSAISIKNCLNIIVYSPSTGADEALVAFFVYQYSVYLTISCKFFPSNDISTVFPHSNAQTTFLTLWVMIYNIIVILYSLVLHAEFA